MISDHDRSGWFGASDVSLVMGNWQTLTFKRFWLEKLGIRQSTLSTKAMKVGTQYEHKILNTVPNVTKDRQILIPELHLRVNLDGETEDTIHEVKTYKDGEFKVSKGYREQVLVQMFASGKRKAQIDAYRLTDSDYRNYFNEIDLGRLSSHPVAYDEEFISKYLERLKYLCECLEKGVMPK
jgi:hypothetical protein